MMRALSSILAILCAFVAAAQAQNIPHIGFVYPAGGQQGSTFTLSVGGQFLATVTNAYISGKGVHAAFLEYTRPLTQKEFTNLRDELKDLQAKRAAALKPNRKKLAEAPAPWTATDAARVAEILKKLANPPNRQGNPAIAETVTIKLALDETAESGPHELRLGSVLGLSNPLVFHVGELKEFSKPFAKAPPEPRRAKEGQLAGPRKLPPTDLQVSLPCVVNGQILPGAIDRYRFAARQGQRLVLAASARELIPYLPDAVPGWFQATLALYDSKGQELAYDDDFMFHPDPVISFEIPKDGEYSFAIHDAIYRGREDFVYRVAIGELPFLTSIFPLGGPAGSQTTVQLRGWNLPVTNMVMDAKKVTVGLQEISVRKEAFISNRLPFAVDTLPECLEQETNNSIATAQSVTLPIIINGRVDYPGDWDVFRFEGHAGDTIVAEVYARRLDSPLDSVLKLTDATGHQLAFNDDHEDKGSGLNTHHADSYLSARLPADGAFYIHLGDAQHKGGPDYAYRLRISPPQPDFALRVTPSSINARAGGSVPITVYALRKDGFTNEISLALKSAPAGCNLSGGWIPAGQDQVRLTFNAPFLSPIDPFAVQIEGAASIAGRQVARTAVPAEDMMQAFAYRHLVPVQELKVDVSKRGAGRGFARVLTPTPVRIAADGTSRIRIAAPRGPLANEPHLELSEPPEGLTLEKVVATPMGAELVLKGDAAKLKPGLQGNLIVYAFANRAPNPANKKMPANKVPALVLPAIPFEVVNR